MTIQGVTKNSDTKYNYSEIILCQIPIYQKNRIFALNKTG